MPIHDGSDQNELKFLKEQLVLVPVLGTALAIAYDVGFFNGVDISLFTLFSISEHVVFALQALPAAIVAAGVLGILFYTVINFEPALDAGIGDRGLRKLYAARWIIRAIMTIGWAILIIASLRAGRSAFIALLAGGLTAAFLDWLRSPRRSKFGIVFTLSIFVFAAAYALGWHSSGAYLQGKDASHQIVTESGETLRVNIIRSGDRGILFVDVNANQLGFLRWDKINKITVKL